jgi:hypothetical protein
MIRLWRKNATELLLAEYAYSKECYTVTWSNNCLQSEILLESHARGNIFRIENPSVWQIPMFRKIFPMKNMGRSCTKSTDCIFQWRSSLKIWNFRANWFFFIMKIFELQYSKFEHCLVRTCSDAYAHWAFNYLFVNKFTLYCKLIKELTFLSSHNYRYWRLERWLLLYVLIDWNSILYSMRGTVPRKKVIYRT